MNIVEKGQAMPDFEASLGAVLVCFSFVCVV